MIINHLKPRYGAAEGVMNILSLLLVLTTLLPFSPVIATSETTGGPSAPHDTVQTLTDANFDSALKDDPANNGLWLLKFYAPWCGHCKKMAPVLDEVASQVKGEMAIGKVDCTRHKKLCSRFDVKSFPTLMYYHHGSFHDYPGGRNAADLLTFSRIMNRPAVTHITTHAAAYDEVAAEAPDGVAFVAFASDQGDRGEVVKVFEAVARQRQAHSRFAVLTGGEGEEVEMFGIETKPFIIKIEKDVAPVLYTGTMDIPNLLEFVKTNSLPLVTELGVHNFHALSKLNKPLAIMAIDPDRTERQTQPFLEQLRIYAAGGQHRADYIFCKMDGKRWERFLSSFDVAKSNLPELFILDPNQKIFWQDASILTVGEFIAAVKRGEIPARKQDLGGGGPFKQVKDAFMSFMPYSAIFMVAVFALFYFIFTMVDDEEQSPAPSGGKAKKQGKKD